MRDAFFFLSVAGLALSVAGFAGIVSAFRNREQGWTRTELWRLRAIPRLSITLVFLALLPFPIYALTGDEAVVVRVVSGLVLLAYLFETVAAAFDRASWPGRTWLVGAVGSFLFGLVSLVNLVAAQVGLLEIALLLLLLEPAALFVRVLGHFEPPLIEDEADGPPSPISAQAPAADR